MGGSSSQASRSDTTSISNSYNRTYSLSNIGNIGFGDEALETISGRDTTIDRALPWIIGGALAIMLIGSLRK